MIGLALSFLDVRQQMEIGFVKIEKLGVIVMEVVDFYNDFVHAHDDEVNLGLGRSPAVTFDLNALVVEMELNVLKVMPHVVLVMIQVLILDVALVHDGVEALGLTNSHHSFVMGSGSSRQRMELQR